MGVVGHPIPLHRTGKENSLFIINDFNFTLLVFLACSLRVSDYPYLCLGYRLPQGRSMAIALQIRNIWYIVSFSGSSPAHLTLLDSFWSDSTENGAIDDDRLVRLLKLH